MWDYLRRPRSSKQRRLVLGTIFAVTMLAVLFPAIATGPLEQRINLSPPSIEMGAFYNGAQVKIEGVVERNNVPVVAIRGATGKETFNKKGRAGPIWVNSGKVEISGVPSLFLCFAPAPLDRLLSRSEIDKYQLDETALKNQMIIEPARLDQQVIREHYLELKKQEGVLQIAAGELKMGAPTDKGIPYSVAFQWPNKAQPATYEVSVYECRGGAVAEHFNAPLKVVAVGFPASVGRLARSYGTVYGFLSVLIALIAGFGMDLVASRLIKRKKRVKLIPPVPAAEPAATAAQQRGAAMHAQVGGRPATPKEKTTGENGE